MTDTTQPRRGRPPSGHAVPNAERQKQYRERQKAKLAQAAPRRTDLDAVADLHRQLDQAREEVRRLNQEGDRLAVENDQLRRQVKALRHRETDLCKRLDQSTAERDQARAAKVAAETARVLAETPKVERGVRNPRARGAVT